MNKMILTVVLVVLTNALFAQDIFKATSGVTITVSNGASLYINGGIVLDAGSNFKNDGLLNIDKMGVASANFTDNSAATYNYGAGTFTFLGNGTQTIKSINQFQKINVVNAGLTLASNIKSNSWYLKTGNVNTGSFIAIATSPLATGVEADISNINFSNSWIVGNLRRYITPATVNNYKFPVGNTSKVNLAEMDNLIANPLTGVTFVTASFGAKPGIDAGLNASEPGLLYTSVNTAGVWYLTPDVLPGSGKYDLKLFFDGFTGLTDNAFGILRRTDASSTAVDWVVPAGSILPLAGSLGRTVAGGYVRRNAISTFSQFGLGMAAAATPLPLHLLTFYAVKKDKSIQLKWTTANEVNTSHFELIKGAQPFSLSYLDKVAAAGTSTTNLDYNYTDLNPKKGTSYYQLKMVDNDNMFKMSNVVKVIFDDVSTFSVYPNPVTNNILFVNYSGAKIKAANLVAIDGRQVGCSIIRSTDNQLKITIPSSLAKGTYTLQLITAAGAMNTKVVVE